MERLSPEVIELILQNALGGTYEMNKRRLLQLQKTSNIFIIPARRLLFRTLHIKTPLQIQGLRKVLKEVGSYVKHLTIDHSVYSNGKEQPSEALLITILSCCPNLVSINTPFSLEKTINNKPSLYPSSLKRFQCAEALGARNGLPNDSDEDSDDDSDISSSESGSDGKQAKQAYKDLAIKQSHYVPSVLRKVMDLPITLTSLYLRGGLSLTLPAHCDEPKPTIPFPLHHLKTLEIVQSKISNEIFKWIANPSIKNNTLKRLKLWTISEIEEPEILAIIERCGSNLEEFVYKSNSRAYMPSDGTFINRAVEVLSGLKVLTIGPGSSNRTVYPHISSTSITQLCIALPQDEETSLNNLILSLHTGNLSKVRKFELYSQLYFPAPVEIEVLDDIEDSSSTQLRELRLSHVDARTDHFNRLLRIHGGGIRILALHHLNKCFSDFLDYCPNLLRLELGVDAFHAGPSAHEFLFDLPMLHLLRIHFQSGVLLSEVVQKLKSGQGLPSVKTLDLTGIFPDQVPEEWTGKLIQEALEVCQSKGIEFCFNGRNVNSTGDLWSSLLEHHRYNS